MRDIELRAWNKESGYWIDNFSISNCGEFIYLEDGFERGISDVILEQFIGRSDKNGKKIFKGDIIHSDLTGITYIVEFNKEEGCYEGVEISGKNYCLPYKEMHKYPVIGNRHENPELLDSNKDNI